MKFKELEYEGNTYQVPVVENLCQKVWEAVQVEGAYNQESLHGDNSGDNCGTIHCFAGHIIHQAGDDGYKLDDELKYRLQGFAASRMIFEASTGNKIKGKWFRTGVDSTKVLAEIRRLAMEEPMELFKYNSRIFWTCYFVAGFAIGIWTLVVFGGFG